MLDLEVVPERSLGCDVWEFILGMHFSQAVMIVQSQVGIIKNVQVTYSDQNPLSTDLEINLTQDGIRLKFDPITQRLKIIEVYNMKLVKLKYCGISFNSSEVCPSIDQIEHSFGATHPGEYNAEKQTYTLYFRGLCFHFPATKCQSQYYTGSPKYRNLPPPYATSTCIYMGSCAAGEMVPLLPLSCYLGQLYTERAVALDNITLRLHLYTEGASRSLEPRKESLTRLLRLGDSAQDIVTTLGAPNRVFYKSEDKMRIHSPNSHRRVQARRSDYFFNYFTLGMDILFDARTQQAKKFVLHTNYPGHYNFNMYHRCEFLLSLPGGQSEEGVQITAYTKWDTICEELRPSDRPVVLNRAFSVNTKNFFGATLCYGLKQYIFEIMPNQHIASVTIYQLSHT